MGWGWEIYVILQFKQLKNVFYYIDLLTQKSVILYSSQKMEVPMLAAYSHQPL